MIMGESVPNMNKMPNMEFNEDFAKSSRTHLNQSFEKTHRLFPDIQPEHRVNFYVIRVTTKAKKNTGENLNWTPSTLTPLKN